MALPVRKERKATRVHRESPEIESVCCVTAHGIAVVALQPPGRWPGPAGQRVQLNGDRREGSLRFEVGWLCAARS